MAAYTKTYSRSSRLLLMNTFWNKGFQKSKRHPGRSLLNIGTGSWQLPNMHTFWQLSPTYFHTSCIQKGKIVPFTLTDIGEGINEVTIKEWFVKVEDKVSQFDNICEVQSDKASVTITSRYDGVIKKIYYEIDDIASVGKPLIDVEVDGIEDEKIPVSEEGVKASSTVEDKQSSLFDKALATPAVRRLAMENNIKLSSVPGTGKGGRVLKEDILAFLNKIPSAPPIQKPTLPPPPPSKPEQHLGDEKIEPIQGFRKAMVKSMTISGNIPQFVYSDEISVVKLVNLCAELKELASSKNVKLTYMPFFIKAASKALEEFPLLNATVDAACENIIFRKHHNIGVAMDTVNGLVVPNIKNVQNLSIMEVARELNRLQNLGKKGSLGKEDLIDGTFSLSNIGAIGGTYTKPLIIPNQVAIGALGKIQVVPRYDEQENVIKAHIISISWSADHRVIDGATMARFSNLWKKYVETPTSLLFN